MIASLTGVLTYKSPDGIVVEVSGVGYEVHVPLSTFYRLPDLKQSLTLHTHTYLREDTLQLFGFCSRRERQVFLLLLGVSGIGPKVALNILSGIEVEEFIDAVQHENTVRLISIPGIGRKTAARLLLELKEKLALLAVSDRGLAAGAPPGPEEDALSALVNLGYQRAQAKAAVEKIAKSSGGPLSVEELVKGALKALIKG